MCFCLSVLVVFTKSFHNKGDKEGEYKLIGGCVGGG